MERNPRFHGSDPTPVITLNWGWQNLAELKGFILVKPASTYNANSHQWNWNSYFMDASFTAADVGTCTMHRNRVS